MTNEFLCPKLNCIRSAECIVYTLEQRWEILRHYYMKITLLLQNVCEFSKKRSTVSSVCSLSCDKSARNWHPHR